jgi:transcriptional regulator with XRE-family HTH domain
LRSNYKFQYISTKICSMSKIAQNIRHLRNLKGLSQEQMADSLRITRSRLGSYEESRSEPSIEMLISLSNYFQVAVDALIRTDLSKTDLKSLVNLEGNRLLFPVSVDRNGKELIELVPVRAHAGYLQGYADPEYVEELPTFNLPFAPVGKHRAFPIKGDSMLPIRDGSFVVGRYVETLEDVKNNSTYVLLTRNDGLVYKRVFSRMREEKKLLLVSDNRAYQPYEVSAEDVLEMWEFTCCINTAAYQPEELNMDSIYSLLRSLQVEVAWLRGKVPATAK